jgi:hypothetical protein
MVSAGEVLDELIERAADRRRKKRGSGNLLGGLQMELFAEQPAPRDPDRPLFDVMPEKYTTEGLRFSKWAGSSRAHRQPV